MRIINLVSAEAAAAVAGAALVTFLVDVAGISPYWLLMMLPLLGIVISARFAKYRLQVLTSGVTQYFKSFPHDLGKSYWRQASREMGYWGVTGASIQEDLRQFFHSEIANSSCYYRFLLMDPEGRAIKDQIAFKKGYPASGRSAEQDANIEAELKVEQQRFGSTVAVLTATRAFRESPRRLEIRVFDEFLPWWVYVLDGERLVLGVLQVGQEVGDQPAAIITKSSTHSNLFECFYGNFDRVWRNAHAL